MVSWLPLRGIYTNIKIKIQDFTTPELTTAIDTNFGGMMRLIMPSIPETDWHDEKGLCRLVSGIPHPFANIVWGGNFPYESCNHRIQETLEPIIERDVQIYGLSVRLPDPIILAPDSNRPGSRAWKS